MALYAVVENGTVSNVIVWDGSAPLVLDTGAQAIAVPNGVTVAAGYSYANATFTAASAPSAPTLAQQAFGAVLAGLTIVSTGTPALNATYACDPTTQAKVMATAQFIAVNGRFPAAQTQLAWPDITGALHTFPTMAEFSAFATAMGDYVAGLDLVINGVLTALPASTATIA